MRILHGLIFFIAITAFRSDCNEVPPLNKEILKYVDSQIGKKVGRGECWDVAAEALDKNGAQWNHHFEFGEKVNKNDCVYPGDIIQFEGVKLRYNNNGAIYTESLAHHTAIIYAVKSEGVYELAHQNTPYSGKKVGLSTFNINDVKKGKYSIYRPVQR